MASATTGNNYFSKSMNSIIEIDDGAGTTIVDGTISTNSISTDNFSTTSLTCNTVDTNIINATTGNIGTGNIGTINSTLGTVTTLNSTTGNIGTLNSTLGTVTTLNNTTGNIGTVNSTTINNSGTINTDIIESNTINNTGNVTTNNLVMKNGGFTYTSNTSTYSEQFINAVTNIYRYILYPPINKLLYTINGNNTLELTDTTATITGTLATTTINNSGTITSNNLSSTTGTMTTLNATNATFNNATINNSLTVPGISTTYANFQNIQAVTTTTDTNLYTTSTGNINLGGSGTVNFGSGNIHLSKNGNYSVKTKTTPVSNYAQIDFKSSNSTNDYDTQILSSGGTSGTDGKGTLILKGDTIRLNGQVAFTDFITTQTVGGKSLNTTYTNYKTSPIFISVSATNGSPSVLTAKTDSTGTPTTQVATTTLYNNVGQSIFFIVLPQKNYRVETSAGGTLQNWTEWG